MKKFLVALLSTAMVVSCCNVAWADDDTLSGDDVNTISGGTTTPGGNSDPAESKHTVSVTLTKDIVYSIDVTWDSMNIPYNYGKWTRDGNNMSYEDGEWTHENNKVTIKNYSNEQVNWGAKFENDNDKFKNVLGTFNSVQNGTGGELKEGVLDSADQPDSPDVEDITYLILEGAPANDATNTDPVGTATITITP